MAEETITYAVLEAQVAESPNLPLRLANEDQPTVYVPSTYSTTAMQDVCTRPGPSMGQGVVQRPIVVTDVPSEKIEGSDG